SISSMIDTVIYMDYIESMGERNRFIQVLKSRGSGHSNKKHEFRITDKGIKIFDIYTYKGEILTGMARLEKEEEERLTAERLDYEIKRKEHELEHLRMERKSMRGKKKLNM
ncbi:MAG: ATPase domain-containing protein, partial [Bacteroidales bacterium]